MRHRKAGNQLGRNTSHRRAMLRNMVTSLFRYSQIETTDAKAKALRPLAEKMITLAKRGDLHARRQALSYMQDKSVVHRLFGDGKDRFKERQSGYLRIIKKGVRKGDGAHISIIQLISSEKDTGTREKGEKARAAQTATAKSKANGQSATKKKKEKPVAKAEEGSSTKPTK
jgi:large subunit ribosomal protein L17